MPNINKIPAILVSCFLGLSANALPLKPAQECIDYATNNGKFETIESSFAAKKLPVRYAVYTAEKPKATMVFLMGRANNIESYCDHLAYWHSQNLNVVMVEWLGNGLSGRITNNPTKGHIDSYETFIKDFAKIYDKIKDMPKPLVMTGFSMGGNIGLRYLLRNPNTFDKAFFVSPLWKSSVNPALIASSRALMAFAGRESFGPGQDEYKKQTPEFYKDSTRNAARVMRNQDINDINPKLAVGGYSYGFGDATITSTERLAEEIEKAPPLNIPVFIYYAKADKSVDNAIMPLYGKKLANSTIDSIDSEHSIVNEREEIIDKFHEKLMEFINK